MQTLYVVYEVCGGDNTYSNPDIDTLDMIDSSGTCDFHESIITKLFPGNHAPEEQLAEPTPSLPSAFPRL